MKEKPEDVLPAVSPAETAPVNPVNNDPHRQSSLSTSDMSEVRTPPIVYQVHVRDGLTRSNPNPPVAQEFDGIAANGGAVASVVLGVWSILGSLLTQWSLINGLIGLALGMWGLTSKRSRLAWIGIVLGLVGIGLSATPLITTVTNSMLESWNSR